MNLLVLNLAVDANHVTLAFALRWIEELARRYDHVDVVTMSVGPHRLPPNVTVWSLGGERGLSKPRRFLRFYASLARILTERRIEVAFAHMNPILAVLFAPLGWIFSIRTVLWYAHGSVPRALRIAVRLVDACVTPTRESFRVATPKLAVLGQGIEPALWPDQIVREPGSPFRVASVSRLGRVKGIDVMVDALAQARPRIGRPVEVDVIGAPTNELERSHETELKAQAERLGLPVTFHGRMNQGEIAAVLARTDVFVSMSATGSLDKATLEAMASGCMVVSCNDSFVAMARSAGLGICEVTRDATALADRLVDLSCLPQAELASLGRRLREIARSEHSLDGLMERLCAILSAHGRRTGAEKGR